jgi:hypothetical protein
VIRLLDQWPLESESMRITWTVRHKNDGSTVPDMDFDCVCDFAASLCFDALAAAYAQIGDSSIGADVVNYRTKSQEYLSLAKTSRKRYYGFLGIEEDANETATAGPAIAFGDVNFTMNPGVDRVTHKRPR